jgi:hypothetical protein
MPPLCYRCHNYHSCGQSCQSYQRESEKAKPVARYMKMIDVPVGYRFTIDGDRRLFIRTQDTHYKGWNGFDFKLNSVVESQDEHKRMIYTSEYIYPTTEVLVRL